MDSLTQFFQHMENLQDFLRHENEMLRTQHNRKDLLNKEFKENLWQQYQQSFDDLMERNIVNKINKEPIYFEMQKLVTLTEENVRIIQNELKLADRFIKRFAAVKKTQQGNTLQTYKRNGRVKKNTTLSPLQTAKPIYHSLNETL